MSAAPWPADAGWRVASPPRLSFGRTALLSLGLVLAGLTAFYAFPGLPGGPATGLSVLTAGLVLALLLAPLEYLLPALSFAFVAAASQGLSELYSPLRWILLGLTAVSLFLRFVLDRGTAGRARPHVFGWLLAMFLAVSAATLLTTVSVGLTVLKLGATVCLFWVAFMGGVRLVDRYGPAAPRRFVIGMAAFAVVPVVFSVVGLATGIGPEVFLGGRFGGYIGHPNAWGVLAVALIPWLAAPLLRRTRRWGPVQWLMSALLAVVLYTLLLASSRAAFLGAALAAAFLCLVHANRKIAAAVTVGAILFSVRVAAQPDFVSNLVRRYVYKHRVGSSDVLQSRAQPWKHAKRQFERNPWLGLGYGITSESQSGWSIDVRSGRGASETGSSVWGSLSQVGVVGSVFLFLAILLLLVQGARFAWRVKDPWFSAAYASTLALTANSLFEGWLLSPGSYACVYFWVQCFFLNAMMARFGSAPARRPLWRAPLTADPDPAQPATCVWRSSV